MGWQLAEERYILEGKEFLTTWITTNKKTASGGGLVTP